MEAQLRTAADNIYMHILDSLKCFEKMLGKWSFCSDKCPIILSLCKEG